MKAVVIDTNVLVAANERADQAGPDCVLACIDALQNAKDRRVVAVDDGGGIFLEYFRHANRSGAPGPGDALAKWLWDNQAQPRHCEKVELTACGSEDRAWNEFPADPALHGFDRSDQKFAAVALASRNHPKVLNATDSDWWDYREPLASHGVTITFLCPKLFSSHSR